MVCPKCEGGSYYDGDFPAYVCRRCGGVLGYTPGSGSVPRQSPLRGDMAVMAQGWPTYEPPQWDLGRWGTYWLATLRH